MNKLIRLIIGLPFISFIYLMGLLLNSICFIIFGLYDFVTKNNIDLTVEVFHELMPKSPVSFIRELINE